MTEQLRNKYNTLTPAEAKKLNRVLGNRQPLRTASVLRKPRAPPIVVTNLDNDLEKQLAGFGACGGLQSTTSQSTICAQLESATNGCRSLSRQASFRSGSLCGQTEASDRRHTINYSQQQQHQQQGALASRLSLFSTASKTNGNGLAYQQQQQSYQMAGQISPHESISNLSFRSSRDAPDSAAYRNPTHRFQTMSVDLGHSNALSTTSNQGKLATTSRAYDTMRGRIRYAPQRSNTLNYRFSDDSFASAKSDLSARSSSVTPTKFDPKPRGAREPPRSASKASLSSSTYKVFQSPFANFKKFFRGIQKPFNAQPSGVRASTTSQQQSLAASAGISKISHPQMQQQQQQQCGRSLNDFSLSDSISHLSLSRSQSPPACPPPPGELKSMSYLEHSVNYSNYDEFTRSRNERLASAITSGGGGGGCTDTGAPGAAQFPAHPVAANGDFTSMSIQRPSQPQQQQQQQRQEQQQQTYDTVANDETDNLSWQMTSLPVYYERNLTTVFEEKQGSRGGGGGGGPQHVGSLYGMAQGDQQAGGDSSTITAEEIYQRIKPPMRFDDTSNKQHEQQQQQQRVYSEPGESCERASSVASSQSPALSSAAESVLEFHRQQPATPYRFSFAQPQFESDQTSLSKSLGLTPRAKGMLAGNHLQDHQLTRGTSNSESQRQDNSSSGNSSNCSSQLNGINHCDNTKLRDHQTVNASTLSSKPADVTEALDRLSYSIGNDSSGGGGGYGNVSGLSNNDADATILSETSTLQGESQATFYVNKCAELERTVCTLKNKLIAKEKELTDLQLSQLNNDYTIERLRKQVSKLERENSQLKAVVASRTAAGAGGAPAAAMSRIHV